MMKQPNVLLNKGDAELLCRFEDHLVILTASRGCDILDPRSPSPQHVVNEWELGSVNL